jgi:hypothetical protein
MRRNFTRFTEEIWIQELTNSEVGSAFYTNWKKVFELEEIYEEIKNKYDVMYKEINLNNNNRLNKAIFIALIVSLILNVINFIALMRVK